MSDRLADELQRLREERDAGRDFMSDFKESMESMDKLASGNQAKIFGEVFNSKEIREYNKGLGDVRRNMRYMHTEYRRMTDEIKRMHEEMDDVAKKSGKLTPAIQRMLTKRSTLAQSIVSGESQVERGQAYIRQQQEAQQRRARLRNMATLGGAISLGGMKGYIISRLMQGVGVRTQQEQARLGAEGALGANVGGFGYRGIGLGMSPSDAYGALSQTGRATGAMDKSGAYSNMLLSRGRSLSMGDLTGFQKAARFAGDRALGKALNDSLVNAFKVSGSNPALMEEFLRSSTGVLQKMGGGSTSFRGSDAVSLLARASRSFGGVYQRSPERTAGLLGRLNQGMGEGGNDAAMAFKLRAVGFGSGKGYWESIEQIQKGATAKNINAYRNRWLMENKERPMADSIGGFMRLIGNIKYHESRTILQNGVQALDTTGAGVDQKSLRSRIRRRSGDTIRSLSRRQEMANIAGLKEAQQILGGLADLDKMGIKAAGQGLKIANDAAKKLGHALDGLTKIINKLNSKGSDGKKTSQTSQAASGARSGFPSGYGPNWRRRNK